MKLSHFYKFLHIIILSFVFFRYARMMRRLDLIDNPNLFSAFPVDIFLCVFASIFGFNLNPIETFFLNFFDKLFTNLASLSDSQLINNIFLLISILVFFMLKHFLHL